MRNFQAIYLSVFIQCDQKKDIINFYNDVYIKIMKEYITTIKQSEPVPQVPQGSKTPVIMRQPMTPSLNNKPFIKALCPQSPLRSSLPP